MLTFVDRQVTTEVGTEAAARFGELYEQYLPRVYRYISFKVSQPETAEDLTSTVFEKALANFGRFDAARGAFSTWIFTVARNAVIDYYRVASREKSTPLGDADCIRSDGVSFEESAVRGERFQALRGFLKQLPLKDQEIISLKFGAALTNREIARSTGLSESNVGTILWRAVGKLRAEFTEWENG